MAVRVSLRTGKSLADEAGQDDLECLQGPLEPMCWHYNSY